MGVQARRGSTQDVVVGRGEGVWCLPSNVTIGGARLDKGSVEGWQECNSVHRESRVYMYMSCPM
jgi:hypothetical protein